MAAVFQRIADDLTMISGSAVEVSGVTLEERFDRPAGGGGVHVSFRFDVESGGSASQGTLLLPLAEAIALGSKLMMADDAQVAEFQRAARIDGRLREAVLEVGAFVSGALQSALTHCGARAVSVSSGGCQGVPAAVRPKLRYEEGAPLLVSRAAFRVGSAKAVEAILVLPAAAVLTPA